MSLCIPLTYKLRLNKGFSKVGRIKPTGLLGELKKVESILVLRFNFTYGHTFCNLLLLSFPG